MITNGGTEPSASAEEAGMDTEVLPSGSIDSGRLCYRIYPVLIQRQRQASSCCTHLKLFPRRHQHQHQHQHQLKISHRSHQAPTANRTSLQTFHTEFIYPCHPTLVVLNPDLPLTLVHLDSHVTTRTHATTRTKRTSSRCKTHCKFYSSHK